MQTAANAASWGSIVVGFLQGSLGIIGNLFAFMLLPFFLFYLLKDQPAMAKNFYRQTPAPWKPDVEFAISTFITVFATDTEAELWRARSWASPWPSGCSPAGSSWVTRWAPSCCWGSSRS